ncbi:unnamed protein product [Spirodela intermedia]|uniref:Uncharacterized protein n=1 Tax=Spirodela intermedia TaxID=51605 RepID=A0A7I8IVE6_SPIIN|nr:unnamed protein product [Spirodela intermedia]CAA6661553.1 unnamed protein product [Spirodela intermedia]
MWPVLRPMSFTRPTPLTALSASTWAALMACCAVSTAVWKPKDRSMMPMSLSTVFGIPATATFRRRRLTSSKIFAAPLMLPSPPMIKIFHPQKKTSQ